MAAVAEQPNDLAKPRLRRVIHRQGRWAEAGHRSPKERPPTRLRGATTSGHIGTENRVRRSSACEVLLLHLVRGSTLTLRWRRSLAWPKDAEIYAELKASQSSKFKNGEDCRVKTTSHDKSSLISAVFGT
jgi:hypothetical protein